MKLEKTIFRLYDLRGVYEKEFDLEGSKIIGKAYGTFLIKENKNKKNLNVVVGRDGRIHSEIIQKAFIEGVLETGINVVNIGLSTSPLLNYSICKGNFDGGVNITASHNPKEFNGFKLQRKMAESIFGEEIEEIYKICKKENFSNLSKKGEETFGAFFPEYTKELDLVSKKFNNDNLKRKKILIEGGNGVGGHFASLTFKMLGFDVIDVFTEVDGNFPNHIADPDEKENLELLSKKVLEHRASIGIAFDGDGDRLAICDEEGNIYSAEILLILLAKDLIERKGSQTIVYEPNVTSIFSEFVESIGGKLALTKTGHGFIHSKMIETKALLGGEKSGHIFFGEDYYSFDDAMLGALIISKIFFRETPKKIRKFVSGLAKTFIFDKKYKVADEIKFKLMEEIIADFSKKYKNTDALDGIKVFEEGKDWFIIRASNTNPEIKLKIETRTQEKLIKLENELDTFLNKKIKDFGSKKETKEKVEKPKKAKKTLEKVEKIKKETPKKPKEKLEKPKKAKK